MHDNVAVSGYLVRRNGIEIAYTTDTNHTDTTGADEAVYEYTVSAWDTAGLESAQSAPVISGKTVKTTGKPTKDESTSGDTTTRTNKGKGNNK